MISLGQIGFAGEVPSGVRVAECRRCFDAVYWCSTRKNRRMALDAVPVEDGRWSIGPGGVVSAWVDGPRYSSHFDTCKGES